MKAECLDTMNEARQSHDCGATTARLDPRTLLRGPGATEQRVFGYAWSSSFSLRVAPTQLWLRKHHVFSYLWHRAEPSPEARRSARLSTSTSPGSTWRTARFATFGSGLFYHQITQRMPISANNDRRKTCSHVSVREALKRRRLPLGFSFFFPSVPLTSDTEQIDEYRVRFAAVWRRPSLDGFTHYWQRLLHRFTALVDPVRTKSDFTDVNGERRRNDGVRLGLKLPSLTQVHHRAGEFQLESPPNPQLWIYFNPFVTTATASF